MKNIFISILLLLSAWCGATEATKEEQMATLISIERWKKREQDALDVAPLMQAILKGNLDSKLLLEHQAVVNYKNMEGHTPLRVAALNKKADVVKLLLAHKAELDSGELRYIELFEGLDSRNEGDWAIIKLLREADGITEEGKRTAPLSASSTSASSAVAESQQPLYGEDSLLKHLSGW